MITSVILHNIQSHEETRLDLHPNLNIIVGSTDSGKTACIRGMRWVIWNRPVGRVLQSWWATVSWVRLETKEGSVTRYKGKVDKYIIRTYHYDRGIKLEEKNTFKAIGVGVPEEVTKFLNINEINLQRQLDRPFLLDESPGTVAKHFNKVANLEDIDLSTQNILKWTRDLNNEIKHDKKQIINLTKDLTKYDYLEEAEMKLEALETLDKRERNISNRIIRLTKAIENYGIITSTIKYESKILKVEPSLNKLLDCIEEDTKIENQISKLENKIDTIKKLKEEIKQNQLILIHENTINKLILFNSRLREVTFNKNRLSKALENIANIKDLIKQAEKEYNANVREFNNSFPDVCPLCGEPRNKSKKH